MTASLISDASRQMPRQSRYALELIDIRKNFGPTEIIRGIDLAICSGERHAIIGPNGAGKTTLFALISGFLAPSSGEIRLHGKLISGLPPYEVNRRGLSRSFQVTNIFPRMSVAENVACALLWPGRYGYSFWRSVAGDPAIAERAESVLRQINLLDRAQVSAGVLTYAEQRALEVGIAIAGGANVILLDEPTAGMSKHETEHIVALIRQISEGRTLLIVEHDMSVVFGLADRVSVLVYGEIIATGAPIEIRANPQVRTAYLGHEGH